MGAANVLVNVHAMAAPAAVAAASSVTVRVTMFGVAAPPAPSPLQVIETSVKPAGGADSVMVVLTPAAVSVCVAPDTPAPDVTVVMVWGAKPLVPVKLNAPTPPFDTLVTVTVGNTGGGAANVLVNVHAMAAPAAVAAASNVTVPVAITGVAVPPAPSPVQVIEASVKPAGGADSVMVVLTPAAVSVCVAPDTATPDVTVVMVCAAKPLLPVKLNAPTPPFETLLTVIVGGKAALLNVHAMAAPAAVAAASSVTVRVTMFGVAVPPAPNPLHVIEASAKPAGGDSVTVVTTPGAVSVCVAPDTATPDVTVVMGCAAKPLLPVKLNAPTPPFETLLTVIV